VNSRLVCIFSVIFIITACGSDVFNSNSLIVKTREGEVAGLLEDSVLSFKGIPYASAPVGNLRWRAPQIAPKRSSLLNAYEFQNRCFQRPGNPAMPPRKPEKYTQPESEDCLYLNVFRPQQSDALLPVFVWIHGGALVEGSGARPMNHGADLAKKGVIVVTINYRLGSFGFFAHPSLTEANEDNGLLYNYGLLDQIAALTWLKNNIQNFGGDPKQITIAGESAGAASVNALLTSPLSKGLFHRAIIQSGYIRSEQPRVVENGAASKASVEQDGIELAERLGFENAGLEDLRQVSAADIVAATDFRSYIVFAIDNKSITDANFSVLARGKQQPVPLLIGTTDFEFGMVPPKNQRAIMNTTVGSEKMNRLSALYENEEVRDTLLYSDYVFHAQARAYAQLHEHQGNATYMYRYAINAAGNKVPENVSSLVNGAYHAAEMPFLFGNFTGDNGESTEPSERELAASDLMQSYWVNFAKYGDPNGENLPQWPKFNGKNLLQINIDSTYSSEDPWGERLDAVNEIAGDLDDFFSMLN